eukprot:jgi/Mesvir1/29686/Mv00923-RA.1
MVESGVSFAAVTGKDEYHGGREMVDDPDARSQLARFERLANGTREEQIALYRDILRDKPEYAKVPYLSKSNSCLVSKHAPAGAKEAGRQGGANLQGEGAIAVGEPVSEGVGGSDGDTAKMTRFKEQADAYKLRTLARRVVAEMRTETAPPEVRNEMMTLHQVAEFIVKNACAPDGATQPEEIPSAKALIKWMQENLFEGKAKERKLRAGREGDPRGHPVLNQPRPARAQLGCEVASTWTAAVDEHQKGLSEALATYKGKALKGKGKGKVEVADAPVSLLEKWEKSPVSQDDDDILDVNDEIAKGKRLRKQLAVQPRDLDEMSKALVHRNRVWTRNLFVGPQKLLARDLHLSRAEQNATIFANSESDYGHDKLVIPVWRYSFQFLADRCPNSFHEWMKKEGTQRQLAQLFGEMGGARTMKAGYARAMTDKEIDIYLRTSSAKEMAEAASTAVLTGPADILDDLKPVDVRKAALLDSLCKSAWEMAPLERSHRCRQPFAAFSCWTGTTLPHSSNR